jgi:hypothetical protein
MSEGLVWVVSGRWGRFLIELEGGRRDYVERIICVLNMKFCRLALESRLEILIIFSQIYGLTQLFKITRDLYMQHKGHRVYVHDMTS